MDSLNAGKDWACDLHVKQPGHLDGLAVWFDLHLDDTVTIATGPDEDSCWEQAIYPIVNISRRNSTGKGVLIGLLIKCLKKKCIKLSDLDGISLVAYLHLNLL